MPTTDVTPRPACFLSVFEDYLDYLIGEETFVCDLACYLEDEISAIEEDAEYRSEPDILQAWAEYLTVLQWLRETGRA